jgi:hypothetical protein
MLARDSSWTTAAARAGGCSRWWDEGALGGRVCLIPVRFRDEIHAIWGSLLTGDGYELNRLQAGSYLPADSSQLDRELE